MSAAGLFIPGCICCPKEAEACDCSDLDVSKATNWMALPVGYINDYPGPRSLDSRDRTRLFNEGRSRWLDNCWTSQANAWYRQGWNDCMPWGHTDYRVLGGYAYCDYKLRFICECKIDRGSYAPDSDWPRYVLRLRSLYLIAQSTGENNMLDYKTYLDADGTAIQVDTDWEQGPVKVSVAIYDLRSSQDFFLTVKSCTCLEARTHMSGFGLSKFGRLGFGY